MPKRTRLKVAIVIAAFLVIGGVGSYLIVKYAVKADTNNTFLSNTSNQNLQNDPGLIRLPEKYTYQQIQQAMQSKTDTGLVSPQASTLSAEINNQINQLAKDKANQLPSVDQITGKKIESIDLVIKVADSTGTVVQTPKTVKPQGAVVTKVEDNFAFDSSVAEDLKPIFYRAYPEIEKFYGARPGTDKIKVVYEKDLNRAYYISYGNQIHLSNTELLFSSADDTIIHELVHAFHGNYCLIGLWEEGFAVKVTALVLRSLGVHKDLNGAVYDSYSDQLIDDGYKLNNQQNFPSYISGDFDDAWGTIIPYEYGSRTADILYTEDSNFFKIFNTNLYSSGTSYADFNKTKLIDVASRSISKVENVSTPDWFAGQYPYLNYDYDQVSSSNLVVTTGYGDIFIEPSSLSFKVCGTQRLVSGDYDIDIYGSKGELLVDHKNINTNFKDTKCSYKYVVNGSEQLAKYKGTLVAKIYPANAPDKVTVRYLFSKEAGSNVNVMLPKVSDGFVKISALNASKVLTGNIVNGVYSVVSDSFNIGGRYKVEVFDRKSGCSGDYTKCQGQKIAEKYFDKAKGNVSTTVPTSDVCSGKISSVKAKNRSFTISSETTVDCGQVLYINSIPTKRFWGTTLKDTESNLNLDTNYSLKIGYTPDYGTSSYKTTDVKTFSGPDFQLQKAENFGDPSKDTFYRRFTFSAPYDPNSVKISFPVPYNNDSKGDPLIQIKFKITQVSPTVFDFTPTDHILNNAVYYLEGLNDICDQNGDPLFKYDWNYNYFTTPVNPIGAISPKYQLEKDSYKLGETVTVLTNFKSSELAGKLDQISIYDCNGVGDDRCRFSSVKASIADGKILITPPVTLKVGQYYSLEIPSVTDSNNNYVEAGYFDFKISQPDPPTLSAALLAKPGSGEAPLAIVLSTTPHGTATGVINYAFWWNCIDPSNSIATTTTACGDPSDPTKGARFPSTSELTKTVSHTYTDAGVYQPKVIVERDTATPVSVKAQVTVTAPKPVALGSISGVVSGVKKNVLVNLVNSLLKLLRLQPIPDKTYTITGATLSIKDAVTNVKTDASGRYSIESLKIGSYYTIIATASGCGSAQTNISLTSSQIFSPTLSCK